MADFSSSYDDLPPLPLYHLTPLPPLVSHIPDKFLTCLLPIGAYWVVSMFFHWIDTKDYFPQYRLHTPAEVLKRNRVSQSQVVRDVLVQQVLQTIMATLLGMTEPEDFTGKQEYDVSVWARRVRLAQRALPWLLSLVGVDAGGLASSMAGSYSMLAGAISGGRYPSLTDLVSVGTGSQGQVPRFATWELMTATALYHFITPAIQFGVAMFVVDTWQYFLHRAMHMNKWLYTTVHSRHHRLYVPYAFGALYNHPFEGFLLDILGAAVAFKVTGMSTRQGMWFFTCSTIKTVDDHCGYALPWDPLQHLTSNNAGYHDVHHQSWGIKTNFSQPFSTFWDRTLGTVWTGGDVSARYERSRIAAQRKVDQEGSKTITNSNVADSKNLDPAPYQDEIKNAIELRTIEKRDLLPQIPTGKAEQQAAGSRQQVLDDKQGGGFEVLAEEAQEEEEARSMLRRSTRKKATSISQTDSFKGLRDRVAGMHGRSGGIIGMESGR
ncbi:sphinganine hydroxylase [Lasallia pustulata]|uniref:Sphinganine hydroxylase n=1 Tax=Lasallia pustulata TaxID=136370 RepID=A0A1W5DDU1_9LECA|nr:sphinganine hydroxylase [Lasallia pustulata]